MWEGWNNSVALLATRHGKETVIAPLLQQHLGIRVEVVDIDTDQFGTFSREQPRPGDPVSTLRLKVESAFKLKDAPLGLASLWPPSSASLAGLESGVGDVEGSSPGVGAGGLGREQPNQL